MQSLVALIRETSPRLIFSLPRNDVALARAAVDAGAEALKVHIHIRHQASGTAFGTLEQEREALQAVRDAVSVPIGVVVGDDTAMASREEMGALAEMGLDFIDAYADFMPAWMLAVTQMERMGAVGAGSGPDEWTAVAAVFDLLEAAVIPHERYGDMLRAGDVARYGLLLSMVETPVIVPTQLAIRPEDVSALGDLGLGAIMIGAIVTGHETGTVARSCEAFRVACDSTRMS